jgi:CRP-like cAMP-binding protein
MPQEPRTPHDNLNSDTPPRTRDERDRQTSTRDGRSQILQIGMQSALREQPSADSALISYARRESITNTGVVAPPVVTNKNLILAALPAAEFDALAARLVRVNLALGETLYEQGEEIISAYFPLDAVLSSFSVMEDGDSIEVGIVGNEGVAGLSVVFGAQVAPLRTVVQVAGRALQLDTRMLRAEFLRGGAMQHLLLRYANATIAQISQSVACNRLHHIEQRLCRWLLTLHDHAGRDDLNVTHEVIARALGVRRAGVTDALGVLQHADMIDLARGRIAIMDRLALEASSCECYRAVKEEFENLYR